MSTTARSSDDGAAPAPRPPFGFGPFVLDEAGARLTCEGRDVPLRPKAYDVLRTLVGRAGQLVTKDELLDSVWGTRFVTEGVIKTTVGELREALGDDPKRPRWIETVPRRGYRFSAPAAAASVPADGVVPNTVPAGSLVGREDSLAMLARAWQAVLAGERRVVFVSGDAGIGKTALATAFVERLSDGIACHGQCVESFGRGEPYLPWLDALTSLAPVLDDLPELLRRVAPSWLAQLPWLQGEADRAAQLQSGGAERMPREMAALLEQIGQRQPIVIVLEDLHWSDHATVQLLDFIARRRTSARVLVLCTFRATDLLLTEHPLADIRRELRLHRLADEIGLDALDAAGLRSLLAAWCPGVSWSAPTLAALHAHTEGVPLFARAVVDALVGDGVLLRDSAGRWRMAGRLPQPLPLPDDLAGLFEKQIASLAADRRELLEAAAVAGVEFDAAVLAAVLEHNAAEVHARCDELVRGGRWLQAAGTEVRPSGRASSRYRFGHVLMQRLCYARCGNARCVELHHRVAVALLARHGGRGDEFAAELAYHFEQGHDPDSALPWLHQAVQQAWQRLAPRELLALAERALNLLPRCSPAIDAGARARWRFAFAHARASAIGHIEGYTGPTLESAAQDAMAAGVDLPVDEEVLNVHRLLWLRLVLGGRFRDALALAESTVERVLESSNAGLHVQARAMLYFSAFKCGAFDRARDAVARADAMASQVEPPDAAWARFFARQVIERRLIAAMLDTLQGRPEATDPKMLRDFVADPNGPAMSRVLNGVLCELWLAWRGDVAAVAEDARSILELIEREALGPGRAQHRVLLHWAEGARGDPAGALGRLRAALSEIVGSSHVAERAAFLELAADLALRAGNPREAAAFIDEAFDHMRRTGERYMLPRLWARRAQIAEREGDARTVARMRALEQRARLDAAAEPLD